jgi:type II secretory ATPase GspE/PulE/Tfp pilus assembly ATPase PilB-like protein
MDQLGFPEDILANFQKAYNVSNGIVLITGPTGSGKTTTLYAILNELNNGEKNIISIENPIEYELAGITQSQVNVQAGMTFDAGLKAMMRLDPDILMVGEIRDAETAKVATESAMTGHLVLSTTHTNDSTSAPSRLIEMGTEPFLIASTMRAILAQRLVRRLCDECKHEYTPDIDVLERILSYRPESLSTSPVERINKLWAAIANGEVTFYKASGCEHCKNLGYSGRVPVYELFLPDEATAQLIVQKKNPSEIRRSAYANGMRTLLEDALEITLQGYTSIDEVFRVVV